MRRVAGYVAYVLSVAVVCELSFRLFLAVPFIADRRMFDDDLSWRRSWVRRHQRGADITYEFDAYDSTKGWVSRPNLRDLPAFAGKRVNTNSRGLRGTHEYADGRHPDKTRILILGDSFTFGEEVSDTETYASYLQDMLPETEIINMGVHGYGHDQMLIFLKEEGIRYEPDVIVLGFVHWDMSRNVRRFRDYAKPQFVVDGGQLKVIGSPVPRPEEILKGDWARPRALDVWSIAEHEVRRLTGLEKKAEETVTAHILNDLIAVARGMGATPVFAYLPVGKEVRSRAPLTEGEEFLFAFCRANGEVRCFSLRPYFSEALAKGAALKLSGHWAPSGHLLAATAIKRHLMSEGILTRARR